MDKVKRLSIEERRLLVMDLTRAGLTMREISERLGVSRQTVKNDRDTLGVSRKRRALPPDLQSRLAQVPDMRATGMSMGNIALKLGLSVERVKNHLLAHRPELAQPRHTFPDSRESRVLQMLQQGWTLTEIARKEGVALPSISRWKRILIEEGRLDER
ncbi:MAG: helix-turn-helix domain-containing protein [Lysobacteraceae bacterium]